MTLLYGEDFLLGVRVLGQSLRETGTTRCAARGCASHHFEALICRPRSMSIVPKPRNPVRTARVRCRPQWL